MIIMYKVRIRALKCDGFRCDVNDFQEGLQGVSEQGEPRRLGRVKSIKSG